MTNTSKNIPPQSFYTLITWGWACDKTVPSLLPVGNRFITQIKTVSTPWSTRIRDGHRPRLFLIAPLKSSKTVSAKLFVLHFKKHNSSRFAITTAMDHEPPSYNWMMAIYIPKWIWPGYIVFPFSRPMPPTLGQFTRSHPVYCRFNSTSLHMQTKKTEVAWHEWLTNSRTMAWHVVSYHIVNSVIWNVGKKSSVPQISILHLDYLAHDV